jgi:tRNA (mo5U34)-methyltransferase
MKWSVKKILNYSTGLFDFSALYNRVSGVRWKNWSDTLEKEIPAALDVAKNGHLPLWIDLYDKLPSVPADQVHLDQAVIKVKSDDPIEEDLAKSIEEILIQLLPWRKGPFRIHDIYIDSEWQSNQKWDRFKDEISSLDNRRILDVGCGNGYYALRMLGAGARFVIGLDPYIRYIVQFRILAHFLGESTQEAQLAPVGFEVLPKNLQMFDTVFSMGVIYHHKSPFEHLQALFESLRSEGELVLETLVVDGNAQTILVPESRYAKMSNVWFIPSVLALEAWLKRAGFKNIRTVNVSTTKIREQRSTRWMPFESLPDFLNSADSSKTYEGYPAPQRAVVIAQKP